MMRGRRAAAAAGMMLWLVIAAGAEPFSARDLPRLVRDDRRREVVKLIEARPRLIGYRDGVGFTLLHHAVRDGNLPMVNVLINLGADVHALDELEGAAPLHHAAERGFTAIVLFLLSRGALPDVTDCREQTALHRAAMTGKPEVVAVLLQHRARLDVLDEEGRQPLHWAALEGRTLKHPWKSPPGQEYLRVVEALVARGADLTVHDRHDLTPLALALVQRGSVPLVRLLERVYRRQMALKQRRQGQ